MQKTISDLLAIAALAKEVHWNARGTGFISVHRYLDEVYDSALEHVDTLAEHMVSTGIYGDPQYVLGGFDTFPQLLIIREPRSIRTGLGQIVHHLVEFTESLDEFLANTTDDPAGQDYIVKCLQDFNKHLWLLSGELT